MNVRNHAPEAFEIPTEKAVNTATAQNRKKERKKDINMYTVNGVCYRPSQIHRVGFQFQFFYIFKHIWERYIQYVIPQDRALNYSGSVRLHFTINSS